MAEQKKKKRRNPTGRFLHVLILIVAILVIFEGRMVINIFTRHGIKAQITQQLDELFADMKTETPETEQKAETKKTTVKNAASDTVAGLTLDSPTTSGKTAESEASSEGTARHFRLCGNRYRPYEQTGGSGTAHCHRRYLFCRRHFHRRFPSGRLPATSQASPPEIFSPAWE